MIRAALIACLLWSLAVPPVPASGRAKAAAGDSSARICAWATAEDNGLDAAKLKIDVDGTPAKLLRVQGPKDNLLLLVVTDLVGDLALIDEARAALAADIREMPPNAWVGLIRAQDGFKALAEPTADRQKVIDALNSLSITGRAGLLSTLETAEELATTIVRKAPIRVAILYITDSDIYNYREDYTNPVVNRSDSSDLSRRFPDGLIREEVARLSGNLSAAKAPIFILHLEMNRQGLNEAYQNGLLQLADATGGSATLCRTRQEIGDAMTAMLKKITSLWTVDFALPQSAGRSYNVNLSAGDAQLTYKTRYTKPK